MGINSDPVTKRAYQRQWLAKRRSDWFDANGPCKYCGSWDRLELHHTDPSQKEDHAVWSWSRERRDKETAKCIALCRSCHKHETKLHHQRLFTGRPSLNRKLSEDIVRVILSLLKEGNSERKVGMLLGIDRNAIRDVKLGHSYKNFLPSGATGSIRRTERLDSGS